MVSKQKQSVDIMLLFTVN